MHTDIECNICAHVNMKHKFNGHHSDHDSNFYAGIQAFRYVYKHKLIRIKCFSHATFTHNSLGINKNIVRDAHKYL